MSIRKLWILFGIAVLFVSLAIMQAMTARSAVAQEPNPTPTPKPTETPPQTCANCCGIMLPGGHTIGGPAMEVTEFDASEFGVNLFRMPDRVSAFCVTVENRSESLPGHSQRILVRVLSGATLVAATSVRPGETRTACGRAQFVSAVCNPEDPTAGPCNFKWRVDAN